MYNYADDTAITVFHRSTEKIRQHPQTAANAVEAWVCRWRFQINPTKSKALLLTRKLPAIPAAVTMYQEDIPWVNSAKYLGVLLDRRRTYH